MKKLIFTLIFLLATMVAVNAQDVLKAQKGSIAAEVNFRPLGDSPIGLDFLKTRFFLADKIALRVGVNIDYLHNGTNPMNGSGDNDEDTRSSFLFGIFPGIEFHFGEMKRLSPYVGAELGISLKSAKETYKAIDGSTVTNGAWADGSQRAFTRITLNFLAGADYYFSQHVYMGVEVGFGLQNTSLKEITREVTGQPTVTLDNKESVLNLGVTFNPAIRLGFCFK